MKKIILLATCVASLSAYGLPTYEPFTEYAGSAAATGTNALNLCTAGVTAPSGELWGALWFNGTAGTHLAGGLDINVTNMPSGTPFTASAIGPLFPSGFPGITGSDITTLVVNPAQPLVGGAASANIVGNSAVLHFAQPVTRPLTGTKTVYISYLFNLAQKGQLGTGNQGRYLAFLASTNLNEGWTNNPPGPVTGAAYTNWAAMFNTFNSNGTNRYACHGVLQNGASGYYIGACDSVAGKDWSTTPFTGTYLTPLFVVGAYVLTSGGLPDTNILWANPATTDFGGAQPPLGSAHVYTMRTNLNDFAGLAFIDRVGSGAAGGLGTNYIANLIIGSTWSYVTGGPEFTNEPPATTSVDLGGNASLSSGAAAAGQTVTYQWVKITGGGATTNNVGDGLGGAGGNATVSGATSDTLTLTGVSAGDTGNYQLVATASGTGFSLNSATAAVALSDPQITASPANTTGNYGQSASFGATVSSDNAPLSYGWYVGATPLNNGLQPDGSYAIGATGTTGAGTSFGITLTLTNISYQDAGNYTLYITNSLSLYNSSVPAALAVNDPWVVTPPANPAVVAGGNATFTVVAAGSPDLGYQWYEGATPLTENGTTATGAAIVTGAQTATLTLTSVQDADNGSYYCVITSSGSGASTNSPSATLTVQDALTLVSPPMSLTERAGEHVAFAVGVAGGGPRFQWSHDSTPIAGATSSALVLTNIQTGSNGTYSVTVQNLVTTSPLSASATLTVINSTVLPLSQANLIVARVGDGAQALSGATGNTLYLDQYTPGGTYVNSTQVPDEAIGSPYPTGGASSQTGSPALLVAGGNVAPANDALYEAMLTLSGINQEYLCFAGYCQQYPYTGSDVTVANLNTAWRGLATVNAFGVYSLAYTNFGLYSGGNHSIRSMVTLDGTNFWTTGQASSGGVKFVNSTVSSYANGSGIPGATAATSSGTGTRIIQVVNGALPVAGFSSVSNLVFSDALGGLGFGLYAASGTPEPGPSGTFAATPLQIINSSQPCDFAFSPDNQTLYIADAGTFTSTSDSTGGGIERWDSNGGGYNYSYTLQPLPAATNGAQGLTVDFSANANWGSGVTGAKIYATTYGDAGNSLVQVIDNGDPGTTPPTVTVLATAGPSQALRGVRFGPAAVAPAFTSAPQTNTVTLGNAATFNPPVMGSAPLFYQWYFKDTPLAGATNATFTTNNTSFASAGNYTLVVSNLTLQVASLTNVLIVTEGAPMVIATSLPSYVETVGDHIAWGPAVTGTAPITYFWSLGSTLLQIATNNSSLALTNIQTGDNGTYTLIASNFYGRVTNSAVLTVTATRQTLSSNNVVVARVGDGAQALSGATGNTLYLDQYTPAGGYVNTIQIPDEGTGQPYGTGSSSTTSMPFGSPALLFAGAGSDAGYEAFLTLAPNGEDLTFAGYCQAYPFAGADVSASAGNGGNQWRGIGTVNAYGYYTLAYTNSGLYSGGGHQIHAAVDIDGNGTNFYATGESGSASIKYCNINNQHANGLGVVAVAGSTTGPRVVQVINGYLVFSDAAASPIGIYGYLGLPTTPVTATLLLTEPNSPTDFAVSPDLSTAYIADNGAFGGTSVQSGGIQRWDGNLFSGYTYSYTLATGSGSAVGARALTVDFSAASTWGAGVNGAVLYTTTAEAAGNRLIKIVDTGASSSATVLATAGPNQILAGVRFGPVLVPISIAGQPQPASALTGAAATFSVGALGSGPLTYQWYFQPNCTGSFHAINLATNATYAINSAGNADVGCYYVVVTNPGGSTLQSDTAAFSLTYPPQFVPPYPGPGNGYQLNFTGTAGSNYTIWTSTDVTLTPVQSYWGPLAIGTFSGGIDSYTDPNGGINPQQFYKITSP